MRIIIVGAGGFAGGFLSDHFRRAGYEVVPIGRSTPLPETPADVVIDCNGDARRFWANENPDESYRVNVLSTAERVARLRYRKYVYLSTIDVYGPARSEPARNTEESPIAVDALDAYGLHKHLAEEAVRAKATDHLILRAGTLLGPGLKKNPVFDALDGAPIRQTLDSTISLITLRRFAEALHRLLERDAGGIFNVTASTSVDVATMLRRVDEALGRNAGSHAFHDDLLTTDYDITTDKVSAYLDLVDSETMLCEYLAGPR